MNRSSKEMGSAALTVEDSVQASSGTVAIEDQLAAIIVSARDVAIVAEELLRDVASLDGSQDAAGKLHHRLSVAPRLLAATQQQLESLLAMLRMT